jgi:hypothetical protein
MARIYAWWDHDVKQVTCVNCHSHDDQVSESPVKTDALTMNDRDIPARLKFCAVDAGRPGGSAQAEFKRRHLQREERIEANWGRYLASIIRAISA